MLSKKRNVSFNKMFEVMSLRLNAGSQPWPPLFHSYMYVNDTLLQLCPNNDEALLQLVDVPYRCLVYAFLYYTPNSVVNWIEVWGVCWPEFWSNEAWCFTSQQRNGVLCSMCCGALSCWKMKKSLDIPHIAGNIFSINRTFL